MSHRANKEPVVPIPINEVEQVSPEAAEERNERCELDFNYRDLKAELLVYQEADRGEKRKKDGNEHASNAHGYVVEVPLYFNNDFPDFYDLSALVVIHVKPLTMKIFKLEQF